MNKKRKKQGRIVHLICITTLIFSLISFPASAGSLYPDVNDDASYAWAVTAVTQQGIMGGDFLGNFNPDAPITRGEFAVALYNFTQTGENVFLSGFAPYADVPTDYWGSCYISWACAKGYMSDYGNGFFGPNDPLLFEQALVGIIHALDLTEDAILAGGYFNGYLVTGIEYSLLNGVNGTIGAPLTRAQLAILIGKALQ